MISLATMLMMMTLMIWVCSLVYVHVCVPVCLHVYSYTMDPRLFEPLWSQPIAQVFGLSKLFG